MKSQSVTAPSLTKKRYTFFTDIRRNRFSYLLILPALLYVLVFSYLSYPYMIIAFKHFNYKLGVFGSEWCGFKNFEFFLKSTNAPTVIRNTLVLNLLFIVTGTLTSLVLAILLNELRSSRMRKLVQVSTYLPHFLSWVVIAGIFINILSPTGGILNDFRALFGLPAVDYMTQKDTIMGVLFASSLWRSLGWDSIIYFAAIIGINQSLYEAAYMDGATRMQVIRYVVLPALITPMVTTFILNLGFFLDAGFDQVFNFTNDAVNSTIDILDTYKEDVRLCWR